jgi:hypothetical protein
MAIDVGSRGRRGTRRLVAMLACGLGLAACGPSESHVKEEIELANYCSAVSDCASLGSDCPFGCTILVNAAEAERIQELIDDYHAAHATEECMYDCVASYGTECRGGKCAILTTPP